MASRFTGRAILAVTVFWLLPVHAAHFGMVEEHIADPPLRQVKFQSATWISPAIAQQSLNQSRTIANKSKAREEVLLLIRTIAGNNPQAGLVGLEKLHRIDPAVPPQVMSFLWEAVRSNHSERRSTVRSLLGLLNSNTEQDISKVTQALQHQDEPVRAIAAFVLLQLGDKAPSTILALQEAMFDRSHAVRGTAACALARIGSREAITILLAQLKAENTEVQSSAAIGLSSVTAEARESRPVLIAALRDENEQVRTLAADALGQMGQESRRAIPALLGRLTDPSASVQSAAAYALGQIAPDDPRVIRLLIRQAASTTDPVVKESGIQALEKVTPKAIPTLLEIFAAQKWEEGELAAELLVYLGSDVDPYLTTENFPKILQGISYVPLTTNLPLNSFYRIRFADYALQKSGPEVAPNLVSWLKNPNEDIRVGAVTALLIGCTQSQRYFTVSSCTTPIPTLSQAFRSSRLYTLWKKENQALVTAASSNSNALVQVEEILSRDRFALSAFAFLFEFDQSFRDDISRENKVALDLVIELVFFINTAPPPEIAEKTRFHLVSNRPAICRVSFLQKFLWRCR